MGEPVEVLSIECMMYGVIGKPSMMKLMYFLKQLMDILPLLAR